MISGEIRAFFNSVSQMSAFPPAVMCSRMNPGFFESMMPDWDGVQIWFSRVVVLVSELIHSTVLKLKSLRAIIVPILQLQVWLRLQTELDAATRVQNKHCGLPTGFTFLFIVLNSLQKSTSARFSFRVQLYARNYFLHLPTRCNGIYKFYFIIAILL